MKADPDYRTWLTGLVGAVPGPYREPLENPGPGAQIIPERGLERCKRRQTAPDPLEPSMHLPEALGGSRSAALWLRLLV